MRQPFALEVSLARHLCLLKMEFLLVLLILLSDICSFKSTFARDAFDTRQVERGLQIYYDANSTASAINTLTANQSQKSVLRRNDDDDQETVGLPLEISL